LVSSSIASGSNSHQTRYFNEAGASYEIARTRVNIGAGQVNRGEYQFAVNNGAGLRRWLDVDYGGNVVFNDDGHDSDFRVSSDATSHMLFVDAGHNRVGIASSSPDDILTVGGETLAYANALDGHTLGIRGGVLGGTAGDEKDIAYFAVESTNNNTLGLSLKAYRKITGNDWTSAGFKYTLNVDNTDSVYDNLLVFQGSKIGIHTDEPAGVLHIDSESASGATYGIVQNDGTANTDTIAGWVIRDGSTVMGGIRRRRDGAGSPIEVGNFSSDATVDLVQDNERRITFDTSSNIVVNEPGVDADFRVESVGNSNMFLIDAEISKAAFGTAAQTAIGGMVHTGSLSVGNGNHVGYSVYSNHEGNIPSNTTVSIMDFEGPAYARYMKVTISGYLCRREVYFAGYQSWDNQTGGAVGDTTVGTEIFANGSNSTSAKCSIYLEVLSTSGTSGNPKYRLKLGTGSLSGQLYDTTSVVEFFNPPQYVTYQ